MKFYQVRKEMNMSTNFELTEEDMDFICELFHDAVLNYMTTQSKAEELLLKINHLYDNYANDKSTNTIK